MCMSSFQDEKEPPLYDVGQNAVHRLTTISEMLEQAAESQAETPWQTEFLHQSIQNVVNMPDCIVQLVTDIFPNFRSMFEAASECKTVVDKRSFLYRMPNNEYQCVRGLDADIQAILISYGEKPISLQDSVRLSIAFFEE